MSKDICTSRLGVSAVSIVHSDAHDFDFEQRSPIFEAFRLLADQFEGLVFLHFLLFETLLGAFILVNYAHFKGA